MSDFGLVKGAVKGLGGGAYLVNALPSSVLVLGIYALITSHLFPWSEPLLDSHGQPIGTGAPSVAASVQQLGASGVVVLAFAVLATTILLRPFQISAVQMLEGYWRGRSLLSLVEPLAVERHIRQRSWNRAKILERELPEPTSAFASVAVRSRLDRRVRKRVSLAVTVIDQYPGSNNLVMPTLLGNVLRRAESTAGERYGLNTVTTFPRLYPYLSPRLDEEWQVQLNVIDTACTLTIIVGALATAAAPLLVRGDWWSVLPLALSAVSGLSYRGARNTAMRNGMTLAAAFDLHRFDMLKAMHRPLPRDAAEESKLNAALSQVLEGASPIEAEDPRLWRYVHALPDEKEEVAPQIAPDPGEDGGDEPGNGE